LNISPFSAALFSLLASFLLLLPLLLALLPTTTEAAAANETYEIHKWFIKIPSPVQTALLCTLCKQEFKT
jgi:hypothetical protein